MKLLALSPVPRQLIIFGLIVGLLWYGSGPIMGPDGRIVCCSAEYAVINFYDHLQPTDKFPTTLDIVQVVEIDVEGLVLKDLPVTHKFRESPSRFWLLAIDNIPGLEKIRRIRTKAIGGWVIYFSVTPEQFERLNKARDSENGLLLFQ